MIDLHCHVLPGVDDGPATLADAIAMCRMAAADGCTAMVATSHQRHPSFPEVTRERLVAAHGELVAALAAEAPGSTPEIRLGAEIRVDAGLLGDLEDASAEELSLAGSRYLLLELPRFEHGPVPEDLTHELQVDGWRPVLAHPEVIPWLADDMGRLAQLVSHGVLLQVTAAALLGEFGRHARERGWEMVEEGMVHFVASDAHSPTWRPPGLSAVRATLERRIGPLAARRLLVDNPGCVLADVPLASLEGEVPA